MINIFWYRYGKIRKKIFGGFLIIFKKKIKKNGGKYFLECNIILMYVIIMICVIKKR